MANNTSNFDRNEQIDFAAMHSISCNIGEEIQWIAQRRFIPKVNRLINKEKISKYKLKKPTKVIMNGWYSSKPNLFFNNSENLIPLLISMYLRPACYERFSKQDIKDFFIKNGPVGCRDKSTMKFLQRIGVPAYFSGCLTLTLVPNDKIKKQNFILAMGLNQEEVEHLKSKTDKPVWAIDRLIPEIYSTNVRLEIAKAMLGLYQSAYCIVTNKLHVACPALALGTPVLLLNIEPDDKKNDPERFDGVTELFHNVNREDFINDNYDYDFSNPPANPNIYIYMRDEMIKKCKEFTGYDNTETLINTNEPVGELLKFFTVPNYWSSDYARPVWYISNWEVIKILFKKIILRKDAYGLK